MFGALRKAVSTATDYTSDLAGKARSTLDTAAAGAAGRAASVATYGSERATDLSKKTAALAGEYRPTVEKVVVEGLLSVAIDRLGDDKTVCGVMESAYELLPAPVRLVLSRERYLKFVLDNRDSLVSKASAYKVARDEALKLSACETDQALDIPVLESCSAIDENNK